MTTIRNPHRERFTVVGRELINDQALSFRAKGLLVWLLDKPDGWNFDSVKLASQAKEGRDAIRTALQELSDAGYLERSQERDARGKWVTVTVLREAPGQTGDWKSGVGDPAVGKLGGKENTEEKTVNEENPFSPPPSAEEVRRRNEIDDSFAAFWEIYPRHVGRKAARRAWDNALTNDVSERITSALRARADWWVKMQTPMVKIPHAATWLNGERWKDEIEPVEAPKPTLASQNPALLAAADELMALMVPWFDGVYFEGHGAWLLEHAGSLRHCVRTALGAGYQFGEIAVRVAILFRTSRSLLEMNAPVNFCLCNPLDRVCSRFEGGVPEIFGMERTYPALMDRAWERREWRTRPVER